MPQPLRVSPILSWPGGGAPYNRCFSARVLISKFGEIFLGLLKLTCAPLFVKWSSFFKLLKALFCAFRSHSDGCSDTSPPYIDTRAKKPLTYSSSTEVYAEVYDQEANGRKKVSVALSGKKYLKSSSSSYQR